MGWPAAGRGRIPGTCPRRRNAPGSGRPTAASWKLSGPFQREFRHFLPLPVTHLGWKMSKPHPARSCCRAVSPWRPACPCRTWGRGELVCPSRIPMGCQSPWSRESCSPWLSSHLGAPLQHPEGLLAVMPSWTPLSSATRTARNCPGDPANV